MAVPRVSFEEAMQSKAAAMNYLRSTQNVSNEERGQLIGKYGADFVNKALSVDSTEYHIDNADYDDFKQAGNDSAKDSAGYDGGKTYGGVVDTALSAGATAVGFTVGAKVVDKVGVKLLGEGGSVSKGVASHASDIAIAILSSAVAAKYYIAKPNKEQHEAAIHLMQNELPESNGQLAMTQEEMAEASEEVIELTEEAEEMNEEANDKIEEDKTLFDFYRAQYEALKAKKESGEALTPDEQALMKQLAPLMEDLGEEINTTTEDTSSEVGDLNDEIAEYQDIYDESAENIANVEGVTEYAEGFDENTRTMMYFEMAAQGINAASAGVAAARLWAKNGLSFGALTPFAAMATAAVAASGNAVIEQKDWASHMSEEIDARRDVQDYTAQTQEVYDEELDNYAGSIEVVEDLEIEVPEDLTIPADDPAAAPAMNAAPEDNQGAGNTNPEGNAPAANGPAKAPTTNKTGGQDDGDNNKKKEDVK